MKRRSLYIAVTIIVALAVSTAMYVICGSMDRQVSLMFAGDILLDRGVGDALQKNGFDYPYEKVRSCLQSADIAVANLECPITGTGTPALKDRNLLFRADTENAKALKAAGFDMLNLANNHTMDYGSDGLKATLEALRDEGITAFGAGPDSEKARQPVFVKKNGLTLGFLGYTVFPAEGYFYFPDRPDTARLIEGKSAAEIADARRKCDILVVSLHWGKEFDYYPGNEQLKIARNAIDSGADIVIGHHPHVLQGVEKYKGCLIFYSLGNFVFDRQIPDGTDKTVLLKVMASGKGIVSAELIPVEINNCRPVPADTGSSELILERIALYSGRMASSIEMKEGRGFVR